LDAGQLLLLTGAGLVGGVIAGLAGVGGGIVFAPVLFFFLQSTGIPADLLAPMTIATSLLCTLLASSMSALQHSRRRVVSWKIAIQVGALSAVAMYLILTAVTTKPWYDRSAFQGVFGGLLVVVAIRMWYGREDDDVGSLPAGTVRPGIGTFAGIGSAAGAIAGLAGVGGGIIMVPAFRQLLKMSMRDAIGTSSGAIVVISFIGLLGYIVAGHGIVDMPGALGYVNSFAGLAVAVPGIVGARIGAMLAHRLQKRFLQIFFAAFAALVAVKMLFDAVAGP